MYRRQTLDSRHQSKPTNFWRLASNILFLLASSVLLLASAKPVLAQQVSLSVTPPVVEILLAPGKSVSQTFTLITTGENINVVPELHLATPSDSSGHMIVDPSPLVSSSIPLTYSISGSNTNPTLTFEAASTDVTQDVYLALVFRTSPLESNISNLTSLSPSISSLILITINPTGVIPINLEIKDFSPSLIHDSWDPLTLSPSIQNLSSIMIRPQGTYEIINPSGKTIFTLPLYPNLVLGNSSRLLASSISNLASDLTWSPHWSNFGPHRLRLTIQTEGGTDITQIEKTVWILPLRLLALALLIIIFFLTVYLKSSRFKPV